MGIIKELESCCSSLFQYPLDLRGIILIKLEFSTKFIGIPKFIETGNDFQFFYISCKLFQGSQTIKLEFGQLSFIGKTDNIDRARKEVLYCIMYTLLEGQCPIFNSILVRFLDQVCINLQWILVFCFFKPHFHLWFLCFRD